MQYLVHHMLRNSALRRAEHPALISGSEGLDYATLMQRVSAVSNGLRQLGVRRGDRVAIYLAPSMSLPIAIFAVSQADAVFVPIHHGMFPGQVAHILQDCGAKAIISDGPRWQALQDAVDDLSELAFAVVEGVVEPEALRPTHEFSSLLQLSDAIETEKCIEKDLAAILYTSGSTGRPKGVMLSHANVLAGAEIVSDYLRITQRDRILCALPLSFDAGLNQLTTAVLQGGTAVMTDFRFGRDLVRTLASHRITGLAGVPSLWSLLAQSSSGLSAEFVSHLRYITNTGGALPQRVLRELRALVPHVDVFLMYGLTEAFRSTYLAPEEIDRRPNSIGKAIPNTEILVLNEAGERCAPGEVGELVHHGPTVSLGYWGHPGLTERVLRPHPFPTPGRPNSDVVCYSGDLVTQDEEGFLFFVGRRDNQIKSAGFRISPTEVEEVICRVAPVRQAAVIGVPDAVLGQHLVGFAIPSDDAKVDPRDVLAKCAGALPRHMVPKRIEFVPEFPMTSSGKVDYTKLRDAFLTVPA